MRKCSSTIILYAACTFLPYKSTPVLKLFRTFTGKMIRGLSLRMIFSLLFQDTLLDVCFNLENEGRMDLELGKLKSSSAVTGLNTPGQQGPPNEGTWEQRRTTANRILTAGVDSSQGGRTPSPPERSTSTRTFADIFSTAAIQGNRRHRTTSQQNKQFDPGGRGEKATPWNAAVPLP